MTLCLLPDPTYQDALIVAIVDLQAHMDDTAVAHLLVVKGLCAAGVGNPRDRKLIAAGGGCSLAGCWH
jgi:hypothetical protein